VAALRFTHSSYPGLVEYLSTNSSPASTCEIAMNVTKPETIERNIFPSPLSGEYIISPPGVKIYLRSFGWSIAGVVAVYPKALCGVVSRKVYEMIVYFRYRL
jgi:hypothetical protein